MEAPVADDVPRQFEIDLPSDENAGHYADFANVWHTQTVFQVAPTGAGR
jgi:hypothetical protein